MTRGVHERALSGEILIEARLEEVWDAWTTEAGVKSFFAPDCSIELRPDGFYEIFFDPEAPPGKRGGEGLRVLALQPMKMFSFTWNAPPGLPSVRSQRTHVTLRFFQEGEGRTRVILHHDGWGSGGEWDQAFEYFDHAWNKIVLPRLKYRFHHGPVNWQDPPDLEMLTKEAGGE